MFDVVTSDKFEIIVLAVVTINMLLTMMQHYSQPESMTKALHILY